MALPFKNDDAALVREAEKALEERKMLGLEGMVGDLEAVIVTVEPDRLEPAAMELLSDTGLKPGGAFRDSRGSWVKLALDGSADFLVRSRPGGHNPFRPYNDNPKTAGLPETRLETFVYGVDDLDRFVAIQQSRGAAFDPEGLVEGRAFRFIQTLPSRYTGNALGFIQWTGKRGRYEGLDAYPLDVFPTKPDRPYLSNIGGLDHTATRVRAEERDAAVVEFMGLTNHDFKFAIYVESLNSITSVARLTGGRYAQVFTSGIKPFTSLEESGPTERYIYNYGTRVHHMAFLTKDIDATVASLKADGLEFLSDLLGSPEEGLKQAFSMTSPNTFLVNEYIHRYGDFDGFFTKSNVTELTRATEKQ